MFTKETNYLQKSFLPKIKNKKDYRLLFDFFESIQIVPLQKKNKEFFLNDEKIIHNNKEYIYVKGFFTIKKLDIKMNIYLPKKIYHKKLDKINLFIDEVIKIIQFLVSLSTRLNKNKLIINYYLDNDQKIVHEGMQILTKNEINSGYCVQKENETIITIYRIEEIMKVTIHELIHALNYDNYQDNQDIIHHYQKKYNISSNEINTHEAYTELWALIINCYLISKRIERKYQYNLFLILLEYEKLFSEFQCLKVFYLTKLSKEKIDINEHTNVLAYFIIKEEIFRRLPSFLKFCKKNNIKYIKLNKKNEWFLFLKKNNTLINRNQKFYNMNKNNYLFTCMRMTMNELFNEQIHPPYLDNESSYTFEG